MRVREVMTAEITTLQRNDRLTSVDDITRLERIRDLPVLEKMDSVACLKGAVVINGG